LDLVLCNVPRVDAAHHRLKPVTAFFGCDPKCWHLQISDQITFEQVTNDPRQCDATDNLWKDGISCDR
jgi:hypothetical protein